MLLGFINSFCHLIAIKFDWPNCIIIHILCKNPLKEAILLQAEILDLKAAKTGQATGVVIESKIDKGKGPVSTVLISNGKLKKGDHFICGNTWGIIRAMIDYEGKIVNEAFPSMPVEILGMNNSANAWAEFVVTDDEDEAKKYKAQNIFGIYVSL